MIPSGYPNPFVAPLYQMGAPLFPFGSTVYGSKNRSEGGVWGFLQRRSFFFRESFSHLSVSISPVSSQIVLSGSLIQLSTSTSPKITEYYYYMLMKILYSALDDDAHKDNHQKNS